METSENIPKMSAVGLPDGTGMAINVGCVRRAGLEVADGSASGEPLTRSSTSTCVRSHSQFLQS
jgi:hypothetical protein